MGLLLVKNSGDSLEAAPSAIPKKSSLFSDERSFQKNTQVPSNERSDVALTRFLSNKRLERQRSQAQCARGRCPEEML